MSDCTRLEFRVTTCHVCRSPRVFLMDGSQDSPYNAKTWIALSEAGCGPCGGKDIVAQCETCNKLRPFHPVDLNKSSLSPA